MSSEKYRFLFEVMALSSVIVVLDIAISAVVVAIAMQSLFGMVSNLLLIEFAFLLVLGGCMMSRQPLREENEDETPSKAQNMYQLGRKFLVTSGFVFIFSVLFALIA
jgi:hypothetical protein